jgi:CO/xanthine dehydrogenase FAD-binding subunit
MRSHPADYELVSPGSLASVLSLMGQDPGAWVPIAGGTEIMVQFGAGRLNARKLVSIWDLQELRFISENREELQIGAGSTYTDLRNHPVVQSEFPLLASAASWTGSIANQNRGTLGGNIFNASPAADSLPALLVYEAELLLVSARGERRIPYTEFHTGYKQTRLMPDELIRAICLKRDVSGHTGYARKVGPRNAQAISKVCIAALAKVDGRQIVDLRVALGSMATVPLRLRKTEAVLMGREWNAESSRAARNALANEVAPIDDIRSTKAYRIAVAGNLLEEFLNSLMPEEEFVHEGDS